MATFFGTKQEYFIVEDGTSIYVVDCMDLDRSFMTVIDMGYDMDALFEKAEKLNNEMQD